MRTPEVKSAAVRCEQVFYEEEKDGASLRGWNSREGSTFQS